MPMDYQLLDSGHLQKWERFGPFILQRPCPQAIWSPRGDIKADAIFSREEGKGWTFRRSLPREWEIEVEGVRLLLSLTDFGHIGFFPEHVSEWSWLKKRSRGSFLNLFAYSGALSLMLVKRGVSVCHLDAARGMVDWAKKNASLNGVSQVRWIVEDVMKFVKREVKRGRCYEGIALDPPTFGRGAQGEVFKIENDLVELLQLCAALQPKFLLLTCHTPGFTPTVLSHLLTQLFPSPAKIEVEELLISSEATLSLPCGTVARIELSV